MHCNQAEVVDSWSTTFAQPNADVDMGGSNDATLHTFEESNGFTELHFSRPLEAIDDLDRPVTIGEEVKIIFAWHDTSDALTYHGFASRGKSSITVNEEGSGGDAPAAMILGGSLELGDGAYTLTWEVDQPSDGDEQMVHFMQKTTGTGELKSHVFFLHLA